MKKKKLSPSEERVKTLKEEIKECQLMMKSCNTMFEFADDDDLIEARIYQMKSLSKHYDYLMGQIRRLTKAGRTSDEKAVVSV